MWFGEVYNGLDTVYPWFKDSGTVLFEANFNLDITLVYPNIVLYEIIVTN